MNFGKLIGLFAVAALIGTSCASDKKLSEKVDKEAQQQQPARTPEEIGRRAGEAFVNSPYLTESQKGDLIAVYFQVYVQATSIRDELGRLKGLLFEKVADPNTNKKEIKVIKDKIVALDKKRLDLMFKALDDVQKIVGRSEHSQEIYRHLHDYEYPQRDYDRF